MFNPPARSIFCQVKTYRQTYRKIITRDITTGNTNKYTIMLLNTFKNQIFVTGSAKTLHVHVFYTTLQK